MNRQTPTEGRRALLEWARRSNAALWSGLIGGAVGVAVGTRLRSLIDRRSASRAFRGTPCSTLPTTRTPDAGAEPAEESAETGPGGCEPAERRDG